MSTRLKNMFDRRLKDYIGDITQIGGIKKYIFADGRAKGVEAFDVDNGNGLQYTILADRGMDIGRLAYQGMPIAFMSKSGIVSPFLFDPRGDEWLRNFAGGFLTTCGLTQVGDSCRFEGREYGLHGLVSNIPADEVSSYSEWMDDTYVLRVTGKVRQVKLQNEHLVMYRSIETCLGRDEMTVHDEIVNEGDTQTPFMLLYHINFGYPFLNPCTDIVLPTRVVTSWDETSELQNEHWMNIEEPNRCASELTYTHDLYCDGSDRTIFLVTNDKEHPSVGITVEYDLSKLKKLIQWKYLRAGEYVMALEPSNNDVRGVDSEFANRTLQYLKPGEKQSFDLHIRFSHDETEILQWKDRVIGFRSL